MPPVDQKIQGERQNWDWIWSILAPRNGRNHNVVDIADTIVVNHGSIQPVWLFTSPEGKVKNRFFERDHRNDQANHGRSSKQQVQKPPLSMRQLVGEINKSACGDSGCVVRIRNNDGTVLCDEVLSKSLEWGERPWSAVETGVQKAVGVQLLPLSHNPRLKMVAKTNEVEASLDSCILPTFVCKYQNLGECDIDGEQMPGVGAAVTEVFRKPLPVAHDGADAPPSSPSSALIRSTCATLNKAVDIMTRRVVCAIQAHSGCMVVDARAEFVWEGKALFVGFDHLMTTEARRVMPLKGVHRFEFSKKMLNANCVNLDGSLGELKASHSAPQIGLLPKRPAKQRQLNEWKLHLQKAGESKYLTQMPAKFVSEVTLPPWRLSKTLNESASQPGAVAAEKYCYGDCCTAYVRYPGRLRDLESSQTPWMAKARDLCNTQAQSLLDKKIKSRHVLFSPEEMVLCMEGEEEEVNGAAKVSKPMQSTSANKAKESGDAHHGCYTKHHGYVLGSWLVEARAYPSLCQWLEEADWMLDAYDTEQVLAAEKCFRKDEAALKGDGRGDILEALTGTGHANGPGFLYIHRSFPVCPACLQAHTAIHEAVTLIRKKKRQVWARKEVHQRRQIEEETRRQDLVGWLERMYRAREERQPRPASAGSALTQFEVRSRCSKFSQSATPNEDLRAWLRGSSSEAWALRQKTFTTKGRFGDQHNWEWWSKSKCAEAGILTNDLSVEVLNNSKRLVSLLKKSVQVRQPWTHVAIKDVFKQHGVDPQLFSASADPPAKTLEQFLQELKAGDCHFRVGDEGLFRVVEYVVMRLHGGGKTPRLIIEQKQGQERKPGLPRGIRRPHEDVLSTAQRVMEKEMGLNLGMFRFKVGHFEHTKEMEEADAVLYPGLISVHLKYFIDAELVATDPSQLALVGMPGNNDFTTEHVVKAGKEGASERLTRHWAWMHESGCWETGLHTRGLRQKSDIEICCVPIEAPWTGDALGDEFRAKGIEPRQYGHGEAKTLEKFGQELSKGRSYLMAFDRMLFRMVEVIDLHIHSLDGNLLVETMRTSPDGVQRVRNLFPGLKRESSATWAIRETVLLILQDINFHAGSLDMELGDEILLEKDTKVYPAVKSIFRKQIVHLYMKAH